MSRCRTCGIDMGRTGRRFCGNCRKVWFDRRTSAFNQAVSEIGSLNRDTHKAIVRRVKQLEAVLAKETPNES